MKALVVYESMYGNTHLVADAIADGLRQSARYTDVNVVPVNDATRELVLDAHLVVVGGPTHAHAMSHTSTRRSAVAAAQKPGSALDLDPDADGPGLREWFPTLGRVTSNAAAFDTRFHGPPVLTGRASIGIARKLRHHGFTMVAEPESFLIDKTTHLDADALTKARAWGAALAEVTAPSVA
jgi:hypothetical protein